MHCLSEGAGGQGAPDVGLFGCGDARVGRPPGRRREQTDLVDGLRCSCVEQFWWAVGRADDQGDASVMCFHDRRMQFGCGGAAGDADDGWPSRGQGETDGVEPCAAFVETHMHVEASGERDGQGRGA